MKQIKSFEHRPGWGPASETDQEVNEFIFALEKQGVQEIELRITPTGKSVLFTVIWEESK